MANLQRIFDDCRDLYIKAYADVREMSIAFAKLSEKQGKDFDPNITLMKFDIILQYSLLQVAVSDYDFDKNEMIFIRDMTKSGDFVDYINSVADTNITWEGLYCSNVIDIRKVLRSLETTMRDLSKEFIVVFSIYDKFTEYNYLADLKDTILQIIAGITFMDGDEKSEDLSESIFIFEVLSKIKELKK